MAKKWDRSEMEALALQTYADSCNELLGSATVRLLHELYTSKIYKGTTRHIKNLSNAYLFELVASPERIEKMAVGTVYTAIQDEGLYAPDNKLSAEVKLEYVGDHEDLEEKALEGRISLSFDEPLDVANSSS